MTDPGTQLKNFSEGVRLLGGARSAARMIGVTERTIGRITAGAQQLHEGFLRDMAGALLKRAGDCRELERRLSPMFHDNLTPDQRAAPPHGGSYHLRAGKD